MESFGARAAERQLRCKETSAIIKLSASKHLALRAHQHNRHHSKRTYTSMAGLA